MSQARHSLQAGVPGDVRTVLDAPDVVKSGPFESMLMQQKLGPGMHVLA